jgi:hypothetical protein
MNSLIYYINDRQYVKFITYEMRKMTNRQWYTKITD